MSFGKYSFGKYSYGFINLRSWNGEINPSEKNDYKLVVGNFCSIASNVDCYLGGNHRIDRVTSYPFGHIYKDVFNKFDGNGYPVTKGDVIIGNDVWIAENVRLMSGITIGDGAVIANNSHVVKNVEPYSIVGGNPAKLIKYRFNEEQIKKLLEIKWWYWDDEKINDFTPLLCDDNIDKFIEEALKS